MGVLRGLHAIEVRRARVVSAQPSNEIIREKKG
jgi:hypothetical protein